MLKKSTLSLLQSLLRPGSGRTLLVCFLLIGLLPLAVVSKIGYDHLLRSLQQQAAYQLTRALDQKIAALDLFLAERLDAVRHQATLPANIDFVTHLVGAYQQSGLDPAAFIRSPGYLAMVRHGETGLGDLLATDGYADILLVDPAGNVLFSAAQSPFPGTNLLQNAASAMARACSSALAGNGYALSDLVAVEPGAGGTRSYLFHGVTNKQGALQGLLAFALPLQRINAVVADRSGLGESGEVFIIGGDLKSRAASRFTTTPAALQLAILTPASRQWQRHLQAQRLARPKQAGSMALEPFVSRPSLYRNYRGTPVIGLCRGVHRLQRFGVFWAAVAEMSAAEALQPAVRLKFFIVSSLMGTAVAAVFLALFWGNRLLMPLGQLTTSLRKIAGGDLELRAIGAPDNEVGAMEQALHQLSRRVREVVEHGGGLAKGESSRRLQPAGDGDQLAGVINELADFLQGAVDRIKKIAAGDYQDAVALGSADDQLGGALVELQQSLQKVAAENQRALQEAKNLLAIIDNLPAPVFTVDDDFKITYINPAGAELTGLARDDCLGAACQALFRSELCHTRNCPVERVRADHRVISGHNVIDPDELALPVAYTGAPILDADGGLTAVLLHFEDISERQKNAAAVARQEWLRAGQVQLTNVLHGVQNSDELAQNIISFLARYLNCQHGIIYLARERELYAAGSYGAGDRDKLDIVVALGEGIIGQVAVEQRPITVKPVPADYLQIASGLGSAPAAELLAYPFCHDGRLVGVLEVASLTPFARRQHEFVALVSEYIALAAIAALSRDRLQVLLTETRQQAEQLIEQQKELKKANAELEQQAIALRLSEEQLQSRQAELETANRQLAERAELLERQRESIQQQNQELEVVRQGLEQKTQALEKASAFKSEFLANMSHELRTPLNSILLLSRLLAENKEGGLTPRQVEFAETIHSAGQGLLELISEILDLSKVEAGKITLRWDWCRLADIVAGINNIFQELAREKGVAFVVERGADLPDYFWTDRMRLEQIIKNFLANAFQHTDRGRVVLSLDLLAAGTKIDNQKLDTNALSVRVSDTGIGIPKAEHELIFQQFRQVDGSTSRSHGGVGLGLAICRRLAELLAGRIILHSEPGKGSTFQLLLPEQVAAGQAPVQIATTGESRPQHLALATGKIQFDKTVCLVSNDMRSVFALTAVLEEYGLQVQVCRSVQECFGRIGRTPTVDCILLDSDVDAALWEFVDKVDGRGGRHGLPVILLLHREERQGRGQRFMAHGGAGLLEKPVAAGQLAKILAKIFDHDMVAENRNGTSGDNG